MDEFYDPYRTDPFQRLRSGNYGSTYPSGLPRLDQQDEQSLLGKIGHGLLSGLGYLGATLGKPGRIIRGLLGGEPSELGNLIPFSDALGITDPAKEVTGRSLLEKAGILDPNTPGLDVGDVAGFGVDILTDPLMWLAGPLTKAGQIASKAGVLPKAIASAAAEDLPRLAAMKIGRYVPETGEYAASLGQRVGARTLGMRSSLADFMGTHGEEIARAAGGAENLTPDLVGQPLHAFQNVGPGAGFNPLLRAIGLPEVPTMALGTGETAQKVSQWLDKGAGYLRWSWPGRVGASLFDRDYDRLMTKEGQLAGADVRQTGAAADIEAKGGVRSLVRRLSEAGFDIKDPATGDIVTQLAEKTFGFPTDLSKGMIPRELGDLPPALEGHAVPITARPPQPLIDFATDLKALEDKSYSVAGENGVKNPQLQSVHGIEHLARYSQPGISETTATAGSRAMPTFTPQSLQRQAALDIPAGTGGPLGLRAMSLDPAAYTEPRIAMQRGFLPTTPNRGTVAGEVLGENPNLVGAAQHIRQKYLGFTAADEAERLSLKQAAAELATSGESLSPEGQESLAALDALHQQGTDLAKILDKHVDVLESGRGLFSADPATAVLHSIQNNNRANYGSLAAQSLIGRVARRQGDIFNGVGITDAIEKLGLNPTLEVLGNIAAKAGTTAEGLNGFAVPIEYMGDLERTIKPLVTPEGWQSALGVIDKATALTKAGLLTAPARVVRDYVTGLWQNLVLGSNAEYGMAKSMIRNPGASVDGAGTIAAKLGKLGMSDADATKFLIDAAYARGVTGVTEFADVPGLGGASGLGGMTGELTATGGRAMRGPLQEAFGGLREGTWNPLNVRGVGGPGTTINQTTFKPVLAAEQSANNIFAENRMAGWLGLLNQGESLDSAATKIRAAHLDFADLSTFERTVMRRIFPFWSWSRRAAAFLVPELLERPGGITAQAIHAEERGQETTGFVPDYLRDRAMIPLGDQTPEGTQRFLTATGLPFEHFAGLFSHPGRFLLGQLNPLIKGPLESLTGQQFFTGRELQDLEPRTGRLAYEAGLTDEPRLMPSAVENILMNSPLSRYISMAGTAFDTRKSILAKAMNLLSPLRVTDVDMERAQYIAQRDAIKEQLRGKPGIVMKEEATPIPGADLSPNEEALLAAQYDLFARARKRLKEKRATGQ